ncbi:Holliday junction resolvase RuvX [Suttonella sp. R2A3]|uniref:Holliday junction resolvase RuvX n=1 Tax=Suttonella sp. R2A3 TaxID=2908648 RepID=UPI001EFF7896|nr:Holliday junction resolvase RuvX [Suttonella sp. R2A3]UJF25300.1 Holliday junction resolvase RuvX [Suttonella sp. R2A3]
MAGVAWVLGIDCGRHKTGVAVGQTLTKTAQPIEIIKKPLSSLTAQDFLHILQEWRVKAVVMGVPQQADGLAHPLHDNINRLAGEFTTDFQLPVYFMDEYLSSHEARQRGGDKKTIDDIAAAVILETWLVEQG